MRYVSTRDKSRCVTASAAIVSGLSPEGGLFIPERLPRLSLDDINALAGMDYVSRAARIMGCFLPEFTQNELLSFSQKAYSRFNGESPAPLKKVEGIHIMELWHGPTSAFKDMALTVMPYLLVESLKKTGEKRRTCILVATSGDTGKAALEGYRDVPGIDIFVFYPRDGVSKVQKLQMMTQEGGNVGVCAVEGNFDDAQNGVKAIFSDNTLRDLLDKNGRFFSSANSINWGRLLPQVVYYFSAYADLLAEGSIVPGQKINFCVPTGNFGNILSAFLAQKMGLPVGRLVCASNKNNVLTEFINTGIYDRNREFYTTTSPSMDILISSNLERLLFYASGMDDVRVKEMMRSLSSEGRYDAGSEIMTYIREVFSAGFCDDENALLSIKSVFENSGYLMDPHTAVAYNVYENYRKESGDNAPAVIVSTASPFKFCDSVLSALGESVSDDDPKALITKLEQLAKLEAPDNLRKIFERPIRFDSSISKDNMPDAVLKFLNVHR